MKSFLALNLQVAEASVAAMHDMPIVAAAKAIASRQAITFSFDVGIGLAGPPFSYRSLDERRRGEQPFGEASSSLLRCPPVVLRENRRPSSVMTVRRFTAQSPRFGDKTNSTGDCHVA